MVSVWLLCVCSLLGGITLRPAASSHFMGGLYRWRPVVPGAAYDGRVQITHRVAWRRDRPPGSCTREMIENGTLISGSRVSLQCRSGCTGTIGDAQYSCTDFSEIDNWSAGEKTYIYTFNRTLSYFEAIFASGDWISVVIGARYASWQLQVKGNLTSRPDTGLINSSPVVNMPPLIRLQHGCYHNIKIPVVDADGDHVRCRWAVSCLDECGGVCRGFPANLDERECVLQYEASGQTGRYAVALQIEDFASPEDTTPLSSIPLQFLVLVFSSNQICSSKPEFVGMTPQDGSCIGVTFNTTWSTKIIAKIPNCCTALSIIDIVTASPLGMRRSELSPSGNPGEWYINVTWTPSTFQLQPNVFCYYAVDNTLKSSALSCITLLGGVQVEVPVPMLHLESISPKGVILSNNSIWSIEFDSQFIRSPRDRFIRIFEQGGIEVFSINVATSSSVEYPLTSQGRTLSFHIEYQFPEGQTFYILLDSGVAVGTKVCNPESPPLTDPTLWTFTIVDTTPPTLRMNDPLTVTTDGITLSWSYNEEATSICKLQVPSLPSRAIPCSNNSILLTRAQEGYSLSVEGVDLEGNTAGPVQFTWNIVTITCGNIKLTDIELVRIQQSSNSTTDELEETMTNYHCAESISKDQTVSVICLSDGVSMWNVDPSSHGCIAEEENSHIISMISSPLSFVFGIFCGLLLYQCVKCMCAAGNRRHSEGHEGNITNVTLQAVGEEEGVNNALYDEIPGGREKSWNFEQNVAYGHFHRHRGACN